MNNIQMVDLQGQYKAIKNEIDTAIAEVIDSAAFINGKQVKEFETQLSNYLSVRNVIACANGTDALQVAMMALDLQAGDEVITTDFTFIATVEVIELLKLKPVLVDIDPNTFNISAQAIERAVSSKTKAIVPVHLFGQCANMEEIIKIAKKYNLFIIEDAAQALGADYYFSDKSTRRAGTMGDIGCTSFFPSKNLGCYGDGGALFTDNDALAEKIRSIINHGSKVKYYHERVGVNSRLDTIQAAILNVKLKHLDNYNKRRQKAAANYDELFSYSSYIQIPTRAAFSSHIYHQYTLLLDKIVNRNELVEFLKRNNIPSAVYYPVPMHRQMFLKDRYSDSSAFSVSKNISERVISLPMHTELDDNQILYIAGKILIFLKDTHR